MVNKAYKCLTTDMYKSECYEPIVPNAEFRGYNGPSSEEMGWFVATAE